MVHVFCSNEDCRKVMHLDDQTHWNFDGTVICMKCGQELDVVVKEGQLTATHVHDEV